MRIRKLNSPHGADPHLLVSELQDPRQPPCGATPSRAPCGDAVRRHHHRRPQPGSVGVSIAGGAGTQALTNTNLSSHIVRPPGAITGNRTITIPGHRRQGAPVYQRHDGALHGAARGRAGGFCYLLPGQSREVGG